MKAPNDSVSAQYDAARAAFFTLRGFVPQIVEQLPRLKAEKGRGIVLISNSTTCGYVAAADIPLLWVEFPHDILRLVETYDHQNSTIIVLNAGFADIAYTYEDADLSRWAAQIIEHDQLSLLERFKLVSGPDFQA